MKNSSLDSGASPTPRDLTELPLSTRTEQRLKNMERFTSRLTSGERGFTELSLAQESAVRSLGQLLVALLRDRERRSGGS